MDKKIAILLSTYNGERYLKKQIDSIIDQSNSNWDLYIRDDGSTDSTRTIIESYLDDSRIHWINSKKQDNLKVIRSFFELLGQVDADYYMFCDQDDVWLPNKVQLTYDEMRHLEKSHNDVPILVHTDLKVVDAKLNLVNQSMMKMQDLDPKPTFNRLLVQNSVTGCTTMINDELKRKCQNLDPDQICMHDWWFALVAAAFGRIGYVNQATILYRQHGDNEVGAKNVLKEAFNRLFQDHFIQKTKKIIERSITQAQSFKKHYDAELSPEIHNVLNFYTELPRFTGFKRYRKMKKFQLFKSGRLRNAFFILFLMIW